MPTHWTYAPFDRLSDLEQGDILKPTEELKAILKDVHHHFTHDKYVGFLVATQTCDLVLRGSTPKAPYITLAVIRPLGNVIHKFISYVTKPVLPGVFRASGKNKSKDLLSKIFNQNEQSLGLFFLHGDADSGIAEPSIALLRITVALRSQHYAVLQQARAGRVNEEYRAKLGWLLGNLYSRPATRDWKEREGGKQKLDELISQYLDEQGAVLGLRWIDDEVLSAAQAKNIEISSATRDELEKLKPKPRHERSLEYIREELLKIAPDIDPEKFDIFAQRLVNNRKFKKLFNQNESVVET